MRSQQEPNLLTVGRLARSEAHVVGWLNAWGNPVSVTVISGWTAGRLTEARDCGMMPAMTASQILVIGRTEVERLLPMERCIELMAETLAALSRGEAVNPLRAIVRLPKGPNMLGLMPAALSTPPAFGAKLISVFPENRAAGLESHQGFVALFEAEHGHPVALVDASAVTAIRTAAVSAVATRALANPDAGDLALLGSGTQARTHLTAMLAVLRPQPPGEP